VLAPLGAEVRGEAIAAADRIPPRPIVRLARLLWPVRCDRAQLEGVLENLRPSREERAAVLRLTEEAVDELALALSPDWAGAFPQPQMIRRCAAEIERAYLDDAATLLELDANARAVLADALEGAALSSKELALKGRDLIAAGVATPGPRVGELLDELLEWVIEEPSRNDAAQLLAHARELQT
jgi:tRNA nucleotidyltransferase (CCA-adding enzyme)